jgi:dTDP-4-dehydrorhamnose reductase
MKIAILGDGLLGKELHAQTGWDIISRKTNGFDITNKSNFGKHLLECYEGVIIVSKYDTIVNCIANTDTYNNNKQSHWDINYKGVAHLTQFCNTHKIKLVHISTDYVYTNSIPNATEDNVPIHGNNWYSYTKLLADAHIELECDNYLICRGTHKAYPFPHNKAWVDQIGNFDYVNTISSLIINLINSDATGIFNVGTEIKSVYNLALKTTEVEPALKPEGVPSNTTINIKKLNEWLSKT